MQPTRSITDEHKGRTRDIYRVDRWMSYSFHWRWGQKTDVLCLSLSSHLSLTQSQRRAEYPRFILSFLSSTSCHCQSVNAPVRLRVKTPFSFHALIGSFAALWLIRKTRSKAPIMFVMLERESVCSIVSQARRVIPTTDLSCSFCSRRSEFLCSGEIFEIEESR